MNSIKIPRNHIFYSKTVPEDCQSLFLSLDTKSVQLKLEAMQKSKKVLDERWKVEQKHCIDKIIILRNEYAFPHQTLYVERYGINGEALHVNDAYNLPKDQLHYIEYKVLVNALDDFEAEKVVLVDFLVRNAAGILKSPNIDIHTVVFCQFKAKDVNNNFIQSILIIDPNRTAFSSFLAPLVAAEFNIPHIDIFGKDIYSNQLPKEFRMTQNCYHSKTRDCIDIAAQIGLTIKDAMSKVQNHLLDVNEIQKILKPFFNSKKNNSEFPQSFDFIFMPEYLSWDLNERQSVREILTEKTQENQFVNTIDKALKLDMKTMIPCLNLSGLKSLSRDLEEIRRKYFSI